MKKIVLAIWSAIWLKIPRNFVYDYNFLGKLVQYINI